jgi:hypothetical protein
MKANFQTKFISENYSMLHGLKAVPIGLLLFIVSFWANEVHDPIKNYSLLIAFVLGALLFYMAIDRYYKNTFGIVIPTYSSRRGYWVTQFGLGLLGLIACWVDITFDLPISFIGLGVASVFLFDKPKVAFPLNEFSTIKLVLAICVFFVSLSPLFLGEDWWHIFGVHGTFLGISMLAGILTVIQGVIWHIFFVKSLPTTEAKDE